MSAQRDYRQELEVGTRSLLDSFTQRMTTERWGELRQGAPGFGTTALLAEVLLDIIINASNIILGAVKQGIIAAKEEEVEKLVEDTVPQVFSETLKSNNVRKSGQLSELVVEEVVKEVLRDAQSASSVVTTASSLAPPKRLQSDTNQSTRHTLL